MRYKPFYILSLAGVLLFSCTEDQDDALPVVETLPVTYATSSTAVLRGRTTGGTANMLCRGVCFSSSEVFSFRDSPSVSADAGEGEFEARTYELIPMHEYNMKAFAVMKDGTIVYGEEMKFSTTDFQLPTVAASEVTDIYATEATLNGTLVEEGDYAVTGRGFIYTSDPSATLEIGSAGVHTVTGVLTETGFSATIGELAIATIYRIKAFAMTEHGAGYSAAITFAAPPTRSV